MFYLKKEESRRVILGLVAGVVSGVASIYIASNYIATKASEKTIARTMSIQDRSRNIQTEYIGNIGKGNIGDVGIKNSSSSSEKPKLKVIITTNEYYNNTWNPILSHQFYGDNEDEIVSLILGHRQSDSFFDSSFKGIFVWKGTEIKLKNSEPNLVYV